MDEGSYVYAVPFHDGESEYNIKFMSFLVTIQGPHNYYIRNNQCLKIPHHRLMLLACSPIYIDEKIHNKLSEE